MINAARTRIFRSKGRHRQYIVTTPHGVLCGTHDLEWALYRYVCVMDGAPYGIAHRALLAADRRKDAQRKA